MDKLQAYLDMATSGKMDEMDKAWKSLNPIGINWSDIEKGNTWEVLAKMLKAYAEAGKDGVNELEPAFQQIFGKRQMGIIRKMGDGSELTQQASLLKTDYDKSISPYESKILDAAAQSEIIRSQAEIHSMAIPESGLKYIPIAAQNQLDSAKLNETMLSSKATDAIMKAFHEIKNDAASYTPIFPQLLGTYPMFHGQVDKVSSNNKGAGMGMNSTLHNDNVMLSQNMKELNAQMRRNTQVMSQMNNNLKSNGNNNDILSVATFK